MQQLIAHTLHNHTFLLSPARCIFWEQQKTLILSDLHLGKTGHFRKAGIAVPQAIFKEDMQRLVTQIQLYKPEQVIVIGDMFHSGDNREHDFFLKWRKDFEQLQIQLVMGNHDILHRDWYSNAHIEVIFNNLTIENFSFVHDIMRQDTHREEDHYFFSGHIHPGISIRGAGKQSLRFPCFYFCKNHAVLPAFSRFTGTYAIKPKRGETVYAILPSNATRNEQEGILKLY